MSSSNDALTPPQPEREDDLRDVIARAQRGDVAAFNILVERFQRVAFGVALRIVGDQDLAADVTQEAILAAYKALGRFRGGSFRVWLLRIVTNQCLDALRARKRRPTISLDQLVAPADEERAGGMHEAALIDDAWDPVAMAEQSELRAYVQHALLTLPEDQRIAVVLSDVEGLSYEEIAAITQTQLGTVKSRIARGRARLRDTLSQRPELLPRSYRHTSRADPPTDTERGTPGIPGRT
jgi:RNA polymerase sigma-70 factor, ECF subfamily